MNVDSGRLCVVTGAFGYTGKYITKQLLAKGTRVKTLTGHPRRPNPFGDRVAVAPFNFDRPAALAESLRGVDTLFNTYWIRFPYGGMTFDRAVANTKILFQAAEAAGVRRIVHISIANAAADSPLPYFRGKGLVEQALRQAKPSHAILRPTVIFGPEGILINNIAWLLKRFPVFTIPGKGKYRVQPVFVEDVAGLAVGAGERDGDEAFDAAGPEIFTFRHLVRLIATTVHSRAIIVPMPPRLALLVAELVGRMVGDVLLTSDEVIGLMANLLVTDEKPRGRKRLTDWLRENASFIGSQYQPELAKHYR